MTEKSTRHKLLRNPSPAENASMKLRERMEAQGFIFYTLTGATLADMDVQRKPFDRAFHRHYPIGDISSRNGEVAVKPRSIFIPGSSGHTLSEQLKLIETYAEVVQADFPGYTAIMGNAADYAELCFLHAEKTQGRLLDEMLYARTPTVTSQSGHGPMVAEVGNFTESGLDIDHWFANEPLGRTYAVPLLVKTGE